MLTTYPYYILLSPHYQEWPYWVKSFLIIERYCVIAFQKDSTNSCALTPNESSKGYYGPYFHVCSLTDMCYVNLPFPSTCAMSFHSYNSVRCLLHSSLRFCLFFPLWSTCIYSLLSKLTLSHPPSLKYFSSNTYLLILYMVTLKFWKSNGHAFCSVQVSKPG